jgi:hypothetical protein
LPVLPPLKNEKKFNAGNLKKVKKLTFFFKNTTKALWDFMRRESGYIISFFSDPPL